MSYKATVSSKGQVTIPIELRRRFGLERVAIFDVENDMLVVRSQPTLDKARAILVDASHSKRKAFKKDQELSAWRKAAKTRYERS